MGDWLKRSDSSILIASFAAASYKLTTHSKHRTSNLVLEASVVGLGRGEGVGRLH